MKFASWMNAETKFRTAPKGSYGFAVPRDQRLLPQSQGDRSAAAARPGNAPGGIRVGGLGRPRLSADGEIYVTGRVKDIIIKGGRNLYPHEVEELAARIDGIRKGCIVAFGLTDEATGTEKLVVVAETRERDATRRASLASAVTTLCREDWDFRRIAWS